MSNDSTEIPDWADRKLSTELPVLRARGENQDLEYMQEVPKNMRELGKEIAAFATSNQGTIVVGVGDDGELVGLADADSLEERDRLLQRVAGVCRGSLRPSITPTVRFAVEGGKTLLVIVVPKGSQPIYYCHNIPYLRHITEARPAEPHEIVDLVRTWLASSPPIERDDAFGQLLGRLASILSDVLIYADEATERMVSPWLDLWRGQYQYAATELRELASDDIAVQRKLSPKLIELARVLDEVASLRMVYGIGPSLMKMVDNVADLARKLKEDWIDATPLSATSLEEIRRVIATTARRLRELADRANAMVEQGRIDQLQSEAAAFGMALLRIGHYKVDAIRTGLQAELLALGRKLHLVETTRLYADGGASLNKITSTISQCADEVAALQPA